ncbi:MAG: hypothetical protein KBS70_09180 [Bacteroidales bacterium]|nr:hypothetical protein [Candidatus Colicola equi]
MKQYLIILLSCIALNMMAQATTPGALSGEFTINADGDKVQFSMGNLIYDSATKSFSFAAEQTDLGSYFGWGTSGYHDSEDALNVHYLPTDETIAYTADNTANTTGYGPSFVDEHQRDITWSGWDGCRYSNYDWGVYNPITNGGNQAGLWRTLTKDEWLYLLEHTSHEWVTINEVPGLQLTADDGNKVFLPAAGYRGLENKTSTSGTKPVMHEVKEQCNYWTATAMEEQSLNAMTMNCTNSNNPNMVSYNRFNGFSVRLVLDVASPSWITVSDRTNNKELLAKYLTGGELANLPTDVHIVRTLYSDGWNTLCLPFDVATDEIESTFGAGCQLHTFVSAELSSDKTDLAISIAPATSITAGEAYIIQPAVDVVNPDFYSRVINISAAAGEKVISGSDLQFVGILNPYQLTPGDKRYLFVTAGNELNWSKAGDTSSMYGMRAYFYVPGMEDSQMAVAKRAHLVIRPYTVPTNLDDNSKFLIQNSKLIINGQFVIIKDNKMYNAVGAEL